MPQVFGFAGGLFGFSAAGIGASVTAGGALWGGWAAGAAFGSTVFGSLAVKLLTSVALSALQAALAPDTRQGGGLTISSTVRGEDNPETIILGTYATAGQAICPPYSHGRSNAFLTHVIEICSAPGASLKRVLIGDEWAEFGETDHADYGTPLKTEKTGENIWIRYYDGTQSVADPMLIAKYGDHPDRPWTSEMVGQGICYAILTFRFSQEQLSSPPRYRFEIEGIPLYDPRLDSSVGGSGPQRAGDPSTWAHTDNAVVLAYNVMRGIPLPGGEVWGGKISDADQLPLSVWTLAMTRADESVTLDGGESEPMYRAGIEATLDQAPASTLEELIKACSATIADLGYGWGIVAGAPTLPVYAFTDDDVIVSRKQELDLFPSLQETYNAVSAKFPDPEHFWETKDAPKRTNAAWEEADVFGRRMASLSLPAVPYPMQVQRLMQAWIEEERHFTRTVIACPPDAAAVELTDTVIWTSARNGFAAKEFSVEEILEDPRTGIRQLSLKERDSGSYVWAPSMALPLPAGPATPTVVAQPVDGFDAEPIIARDTSGTPRRCGIRLLWSSDLIAGGLAWRVRLAGSPEIVLQGTTQDIGAGFLDIYQGLLPATGYQAQARLILDQPTVASAWVNVRTDDTRLSEADLSNQVQAAITEALAVRADLNARADQVLASATTAVADLRASAEAAIGDILQDVEVPVLSRVSALDIAMESRIEDIARIDRTLDLRVPREAEAEEAIDLLASRLSWLSIQFSRLRTDVTDAGIYIDPAAGRARIEAVSRLDNTLSEVSVSLDALRSEISLRATYADVYDVVTQAQIDPASLPVITDLVGRVSQAELAVSGLAGAITAKADTITLDGVTARVTTAEADIDSLEAEIALRVTTAALSSVETRVTAAEIVLGTLDVPGITLAVSDARSALDAQDDLASLTLQQLLQAARDRAGVQADIAYARQDMRALVNEDREALATLTTQLGVAVADSVALVESERTARVSASDALAEAIDDVAVDVSGLSGAISEINRVEADSASASARALRQGGLDLNLAAGGGDAAATAISALTGRVEVTEGQLEAEVRDRSVLRVQVAEGQDDLASGDLRAMLQDRAAREALSRGLADLRTDAWVLVEERRQAEAGLREELTVAMAGNAALLDAERIARTTADAAEASAREALRADVVAGAVPKAAAISAAAQARADGGSALAVQASDLAARLTQAEAGLVAGSAAASVLETRVDAVEGAITSQGQSITALTSSLSTNIADTSAAQAAAQDAYTLAGGKGAVFYGPAPAEIGWRGLNNLWIRTDGGLNQPYRWDGAAWVAVTDKVATDAAAAAASALAQVATKADASALTALTTRVTNAAGTISAQGQSITTLSSSLSTNILNTSAAQAAAQDAYTLAGGKGAVFYGPSPALVAWQGTNNLWIRTDGNLNAPYRWNGSAWEPVTDKVASDAAAAAASALAQVATKADATALASLTTRVSNAEGTITAQGQSITSLNSSVSTNAANTSAAAAAAQAAADLAGSKGKVIVQATTPATGDRLVQNLWIDTTGGANTPKRWTGSAWVAVTDKVATDAGAAAAAALSQVATKADASAVTALSNRVTASEGVISSQSGQITTLSNTLAATNGSLADVQVAAQAAADLAGSKGKVIVQSLQPGAGDRLAQNLWIDTTGGANTPKRWDGAAWVAVTDKVAADAAAAAASALAGLGLKAEASALTALTSRVVETEEGIEALAAVQTALSGQVNDPATGLPATRAALNTLDSLVTTPTSGLAARLSETEAVVSDPATGLAATRAAVTSAASALATLEGRAEATFTLRLNAGGAEPVFEIVAADDPVAGPASVFRFKGGNLIVDGETFLADAFIEKLIARQALISDLRVDTLMIKGQAITIPVFAFQPEEMRPETGDGALMIWARINSEGFPTVISFGCQMGGYSYSETEFYLRRNGVVIYSFAAGTGPNGGSTSPFSEFVDTNPGVGPVVYSVSAVWGNTRYGQAIISRRSMRLTQTKR